MDRHLRHLTAQPLNPRTNDQEKRQSLIPSLWRYFFIHCVR
jgi:hypothetical protein